MTAKRERIGLLGGSFNPVHIGHLMLASFLAQWGYVDKVWLCLSPLNPLKDASQLISDSHRLEMLRLATESVPSVEVCDIELSMPRPSYTINTLEALRERFTDKDFQLVIGSDNWLIFDKWRDSQRILDEFGVIVYPRPGFPIEDSSCPGMKRVDAPMVDLSSTFVREALAQGRDMNIFLPPGVYNYIVDNNLYQE